VRGNVHGLGNPN